MRTPGERIGEYILRARLGEGGFGEVWRADPVDGSGPPVALKIPTHPEAVQALRREGKIQARLTHPAIVPVLHVDLQNDPPCAAFGLVEGRSVADLLRERRTLPPEEAVRIALAVLDALGYAHSQGVVHRDVKPGKILVGTDGRVLLTDFGLGKAIESVSQSILLSGQRSGGDLARIQGTLRYMAPEQEAGREVTARTDLYALGVVLHEMITGDATRLRFPVPGAPPWLSAAIERATQPGPEARFADAPQFGTALAPKGATTGASKAGEKDRAAVAARVIESLVKGGTPVQPPPPRIDPRPEPPPAATTPATPPASGRATLLGCLVGILFLGGLGFYGWNRRVANMPLTPIQVLRQGEEVTGVAFSPDDHEVYAIGSGSTLVVWEADTGRERARWKMGESATCLAASPGERLLAAGDSDHAVHIWDPQAGRQVVRLEGHTQSPFGVGLSRDGRSAISGSTSLQVFLWDVSTSTRTRVLLDERDRIPLPPRLGGYHAEGCAVALSPDGRLAAAGTADYRVLVWNLDHEGEPERWTEHTDRIGGLAFSATGGVLVSGGWDGQVVRREIGPDRRAEWFKTPGTGVSSVAVSADGVRILAGCFDGSIRLWDSGSPDEVRTFERHAGPVDAVAMTPDGLMAASGGTDGVVRLWKLPARK